jgi:hypothetical protein
MAQSGPAIGKSTSFAIRAVYLLSHLLSEDRPEDSINWVSDYCPSEPE